MVDPPRKGCDEVAISTMIKMQPNRIVYVSCDSATLARDLEYLKAHGYGVKKVQPVDMFPHSVHVETVCLLSKLHEAKHHVNVTLDMDELDRQTELLSSEVSKTLIGLKNAWALQEEGFKSNLPLNNNSISRKHVFDRGSMSTVFPFVNADAGMESGVPI